jgi:hypothetical protein
MGYLDDYQTYVEPLETPQIFNLWCCMFSLAAAAQRKVWINRGHFNIAPNLYVVLNAEPGFGKDTAMNVVKDYLLPEVPDVHTKSDSITKEMISRVMRDRMKQFPLEPKPITHSSLTVFATEMSVLIKRGDKDFTGFLNGLYNNSGVFQYSTKTSGEDILINPYLNILACTTPNWISQNIAEDVLEGGLSARSFIIYAGECSKRNHDPRLTRKEVEARNRLIIRLNQITTIGGEFRFEPAAESAYAKWYYQHYDRRAKRPDPKMVGYHERKRVFVQKLAMLFSIADRDNLVITESDIVASMALLEMTEPAIEISLKGVGRNELSPLSEKVFSQVAYLKEISFNELWASNAGDLNRLEFQEVIGMLAAQQRISHEVDEKGKWWVKLKENKDERIRT